MGDDVAQREEGRRDAASKGGGAVGTGGDHAAC